MKLYKSLLLGLLMCGFAACDTADLERDINSLKDRVEDYEAQVQKLNDDMNIIRVLLDGNKTITSYSFDGTNYTMTLSNGETLTLTQGVVGANYPSITIGENGNWIIAGVDSGKKAEAKDGEDAPYTPQFKIENENWWVSYDGGVTWTDLGVKATGTASGTSPISNVEPASDGNSITIKLSDNDNNSYTIPVVKDLVCEITDPELADGEMWYIGCEATETLKVNVNIQSGDIIRPVVPAEWKAKIKTDYSSLSGAQTLEVEVTAPATASKCVVTMEVSRGVNTVTDEIVARTETTSYYDDYMAGLDIEIGNVKINKKEYKDFKVITQQSDLTAQFTNGTVYFLQSDFEMSKKQRVDNSVIIIGDKIENKYKLTLSGTNGYFALNPSGASSKGLLCKNIEITESENKNCIACFEGSAADRMIENFILDDCVIKFNKSGTNRSLLSVGSSFTLESVTNFIVTNSILLFNSATTDNRIFYVPKSNVGFSKNCKYILDNNLLYCCSVNGGNISPASASVKLVAYPENTLNVQITNNTLVNVFPDASQAYVQANMHENSVLSKNLIFVESSWTDNCYFINPTVSPTKGENFTDNMVYDKNSLTWKIFRNNPTEGVVNNISLMSEEPFVNKTYYENSFTYTLKDNYKGYGFVPESK